MAQKKLPKPPKPGAKASKPRTSRPAKSRPKPKLKAKQTKQLDKFGLALVVLVILLLIANLLVFNQVGKRVDAAVFGKQTQENYDQPGVQASLIAYEARNILGRQPGEVDTILFDKGFRDGVKRGDVFMPQLKLPEGSHIEFVVDEVYSNQARAWILLGTEWDDRPFLRLQEEVIAQTIPTGTTLKRRWADQEVRKLVQTIAP